MKILIKSRIDIERLSEKGFSKNTALISITDFGDEEVKLAEEPDMLIRLAFNDVDNDVFLDEIGHKPTLRERLRIEAKYNMLSDEQAHQIGMFYYNNKERISTLICQCEHGQSRSAAVAAAILEFRRRRGIDIFAHDSFYPNKVVFRKVLEALKDQIPIYTDSETE